MESQPISGIFDVIIGTYEEFVLGYSYKDDTKDLAQIFSSHSHQGSVRCVAASNRFIASGGTDEYIQLYDMVTRKGAGSLMQHTGTISSLKFTPEGRHLVSASLDGSICIFRVGSWRLEKLWASAHKGSGVNCIDIHPSSKLAFSLGQDRTLRTWNLVKGRSAYTTNLASFGKLMDSVVFSPLGNYFGLTIDRSVFVLSLDSAGVVSTIQCSSRVTCLTFLADDTVCFGEEGGIIICYNITSNIELWREKVSDVRVKCMSAVLSKWLITACSDGLISVWTLSNNGENEKPVLSATVNIDCRITCMDIRII